MVAFRWLSWDVSHWLGSWGTGKKACLSCWVGKLVTKCKVPLFMLDLQLREMRAPLINIHSSQKTPRYLQQTPLPLPCLPNDRLNYSSH